LRLGIDGEKDNRSQYAKWGEVQFPRVNQLLLINTGPDFVALALVTAFT
jgi:hypothetical protein